MALFRFRPDVGMAALGLQEPAAVCSSPVAPPLRTVHVHGQLAVARLLVLLSSRQAAASVGERALPAVSSMLLEQDVGADGGGDADVVEQVRLAQGGSAQAFAVLYDRYVDAVYGYVYHRVGHRQTAEDLVGDVFLRALQRIETFRWKGVDFGAWLMTIARNRVHDHFKSARFRLESTVDEIFETADGTSPDAPEEAALAAELSRQVHTALRQLKGEQAEVLYLRFIQHLDVNQTATVMGKTDGAVKALQYRALRSLAKLLPEGVVAA